MSKLNNQDSENKQTTALPDVTKALNVDHKVSTAKTDSKVKEASTEQKANIVKSNVTPKLEVITADKLSSKVAAIRSSRSNLSEGVKISKSTQVVQKSMNYVRRPSASKLFKTNQWLEEMKSGLAFVQSLPGAKMAFDEMCLERQGFHFKREVVNITKRGFIYHAFGMTTVPVVCKVMLLEDCSSRVKDNFLKNSARILRFVGGSGSEPPHRCFIRVYDIFQVELKTYTFMDEMPCLNLDQVIKGRVKYTQQEVREWMLSLCDAVQFVQARGIAHRRVKIEHILFDRSTAVKLAGWNESVFFWDAEKGRVLMQSSEPKSFKNCHLPPEAFTGSYDPSKADNWSLGVLLVALHTRRNAFKPKSKMNFSSQWSAFVDGHRVSAEVKDSLKSVFSMNPDERPTIASFLGSSYFRAPVSALEQPKHKGRNKSAASNSSISKKSNFVSPKNRKVKSKPSGSISGSPSAKVDVTDDLEEEERDDSPKDQVKSASSGKSSHLNDKMN